jgi:hypothetical protein
MAVVMLLLMICVKCTSSKTSNPWLPHCHMCSIGKILHTIEKLMNICMGRLERD